MSDPSALLLKALEALRSDLGSLRDDVGSARAEANAQHVATIQQLDGLSEYLKLINTRVAGLEAKHHGHAVQVTGVSEIARAALLG
jgi:hypothetical protein